MVTLNDDDDGSRRRGRDPGAPIHGRPPPPSFDSGHQVLTGRDFLSFFSFPPLKINEILLFLSQGSECKLF